MIVGACLVVSCLSLIRATLIFFAFWPLEMNLRHSHIRTMLMSCVYAFCAQFAGASIWTVVGSQLSSNLSGGGDSQFFHTEHSFAWCYWLSVLCTLISIALFFGVKRAIVDFSLESEYDPIPAFEDEVDLLSVPSSAQSSHQPQFERRPLYQYSREMTQGTEQSDLMDRLRSALV